MFGLKFIISLISFNLLVSQAGLNVYMMYCCCKKSIEYSFLPKEDKCLKSKSNKTCCSKSSSCSSKGIQNGTCKSHFVTYKSFNSKAPVPNTPTQETDLCVSIPIVSSIEIRFIKPIKKIINRCSILFVLSGTDIILRKCNWLC